MENGTNAEKIIPTKNLANCTNVEFLVQTNKIRKQVADWLDVTQILEIRKHQPTLIEIADDMPEDKKKAAEAENEKRKDAQWKQNISDMIDSALEQNAEKTTELIGMMCFLTPEETKKVKPFFLIRNFMDMLNDEDVLGFFVSFMRSELITILMRAKQ